MSDGKTKDQCNQKIDQPRPTAEDITTPAQTYKANMTDSWYFQIHLAWTLNFKKTERIIRL